MIEKNKLERNSYRFKDTVYWHWPWIWDSLRRFKANWSVSLRLLDTHVLVWGTIANIDQHLLIKQRRDNSTFDSEEIKWKKQSNQSSVTNCDMLWMVIGFFTFLLSFQIRTKSSFNKSPIFFFLLPENIQNDTSC